MRREEIHPGMRLRVGQGTAAMDHTDGWNNLWYGPYMDEFVGRVMTVSQVTEYGIYFDEDPHDSGFPWMVMEPECVVTPPSLIDTDLMGPTIADRRQILLQFRIGPAVYSAGLNHQTELQNQAADRADRCHEYLRRRRDAINRMWSRLDESRYQRLAHMSREGRITIKAVYADCGETIGQILHEWKQGRSLREGDLIESLSRLREINLNGAANAYSAFFSHDPDIAQYVSQCDECGVYEATDELRNTNRHDHVCESCIDDNYRWSNYDDQYLHTDDACPLYESTRRWRERNPDDWILPESGRDIYDEHPDEPRIFFDEGTYYELFGSPDEEDDHEDCSCSVCRDARESERNPGGRLDQYHTASRDFTEKVTAGSPYPALGVELEVYCEQRGDAVAAVRAVGDGHICERDGSLSDDYGFEVVTKPFGKPEWDGVAQRLLDACKAHNVLGYNALRGTYGIHVTVHRRHLSALQEARIMMLLSAAENYDFVRVIAQRSSIYGGDGAPLNIGSHPKLRQKLSILGGVGRTELYDERRGYYYEKKLRGVGKYAPVHLKGKLAEFRIFQSTTFLPSFMKNLEFVWALIEWTSPKAATGTSWHHEDFCRWLGARPMARHDYPNLMAYLQRQAYVVKGGAKVTNTWSPALVSAMLTSKCKAPMPELDEAESETRREAITRPLITPAAPPTSRPVSEATRIRLREAAQRRERDASGRFVSDRWIDWTGGSCPDAAEGVEVEVRLRNGQTTRRDRGESFSWLRMGGDYDIVAYRVVRGVAPEGWIAWQGGVCPDDARGVEIEVRYRNGRLSTGQGDDFRWSDEDADYDVVAYRILGAPRDDTDEEPAAEPTPTTGRTSYAGTRSRPAALESPETDPEGWSISSALLDELAQPPSLAELVRRSGVVTLTQSQRLTELFRETMTGPANPDPRGEWIEWAGGEMPVPRGTRIDVRYRDEATHTGIDAGGDYASYWGHEGQTDSTRIGAGHPSWSGVEIVAYRVVPQAIEGPRSEIGRFESIRFFNSSLAESISRTASDIVRISNI